MIHNNQELVDVLWFNTRKGTQGLVKCKDLTTKEIKFYLGIGEGSDEDEDIKRIIDWGAKFPKSLILNFFEVGESDMIFEKAIILQREIKEILEKEVEK